MYITGESGAGGFKITTLRLYTTEASLYNALQARRRMLYDLREHQRINYERQNLGFLSSEHVQSRIVWFNEQSRNLLTMSFETFLEECRYSIPNIYYSDVDLEDLDSLRLNLKLSTQNLIERFRNANLI